jgi:diadenosine tetraphosphate (Ap4A) HIT family hydrolase
MCDHWTEQELRERGVKYHTEHLHFHLVPRYDFDKEIRGEEVLI